MAADGSFDGGFDPFSKEVLAKGPEAYAELTRKCPFPHVEGGRYDKYYINGDYLELRDVLLKDHQLWSSKDGPGARDTGQLTRAGIVCDPPEHNHVRRLFSRAFGSEQLAVYAKHVDRISDELIDAMLADPKGEGDFSQLFAGPLPSRLMCLMLGAPEENWPKYKVWTDEQTVEMMNNPDTTRSEEISREFAPHFFGMIDERRKLLAKAGVTEPTLEHVGTVLPGDFMSRFICERLDGQMLSDRDCLALGVTILNAGNETTINLINNLMWRLLEVPSRWELLQARPDLVENATEESLRYDPPVLGMWRKATRETEMKGVTISAGQRVMYCIAAANRDPNVWKDPDEFRIDRPLGELRKHLAFASGPHVCAGLQVARMEAKRAFDKLVARLPNLRLAGDTTRIEAHNFWGRSSLPVAWR